MYVSEVIDALRDVLPSCVKIAVGPLLADPPQLTPLEARSAGTLGAGRELEFRTGRAYARGALALLDLHNVELPRSETGAPVWPTGVAGSISHAGGQFAVAVVRKRYCSRIGIDIEPNRYLNPSIWRQFLTDVELAAIHEATAGARSEFALAVWCVKESFLKALGLRLDPTALSVRHIERRVHSSPSVRSRDVWEVTCIQRGQERTTAHSIALGSVVAASVLVRR